jgi:hypothetical protein
MLNGEPENVYVPAETVGWVVPNWAPLTISFKFCKLPALNVPFVFAVMLTVFTFTPSAEAAVRAYEPISWLVEPFDKPCVPRPLFCVAVNSLVESERALWQLSSSPACTVLSTALWSAVRFVCQLPGNRFVRFPLHSFQARRSLLFLSKTGPFARNGLSLPREGLRLRGFRPRFKGPGLLLRSLACRSFLLVRLFSSAASCWFAPASGHIHASSPLQSLPACSAGCAACFGSPLGVLAPSGSTLRLASQPFGPPSGIARSSFAPRSLSIERFGYGSSGLGGQDTGVRWRMTTSSVPVLPPLLLPDGWPDSYGLAWVGQPV